MIKPSSYIHDIRGSFSIYLVLGVMTLIAAVGAAVDMSAMQQGRAELQSLADATALAGASAANQQKSGRKDAAREYYTQNLSLNPNFKENRKPNIIFDDTAREVKVTVQAQYDLMFMGMLGMKNPTISASSVSNFGVENVPPYSIAFVFDVSGSMGWPTSDGHIRIDVLKQATEDLFETLEDEAERPDLMMASMSTSFSSYNTDIVASETNLPGNAHVMDAVIEMVADGGTNSTPAIQKAYNELKAVKSGQADNWSGYVVFMTDGNNNLAQSDVDTLKICDDLKSANIRVFTVAFEAPLNGTALLKKCATDQKHFFNASNAVKMKRAFRDIAVELGERVVRVKR